MNGATSEVTIQKLRTIFARYGLPGRVVTDNGLCFTSEELRKFLQSNCVYYQAETWAKKYEHRETKR